MKTTRKYTMGARAQAVEETRDRIIGALVSLAEQRPFAEISLDDVAAGAQVSVQTVLRRFGSRDALFAVALETARANVREERRTPPGDVAAAIRTLLDHYERRGRVALLMLAQEDQDEVARKVTDFGKRLHRDWVRDAFVPLLPGPVHDEAVLDLLVVATDVYTWKLLRIDRGHSRAATEQRMRHLVEAVLASASQKVEP
jgi:AcrR family transcriptional regulator